MQILKPLAQQFGGRGVVLQQVRVRAKADQERQILGPDHVAEELIGRVLFNVDQVHLAGADVDQQADGQRKIGLAVEIFDFLLLTIFKDGEIVLGKVSNQAGMLVADIEQDIDNIHVHLNGGFGVLGSQKHTKKDQYRRSLKHYICRCAIWNP